MLLFILKSSACLAVFMLFYKGCLEKTSVHHFKRFYLIGTLLISIGIPFITFTQYIEVQPVNFKPNQEFNAFPMAEIAETKSFQDYLPTMLWIIYGLGVILFSLRFFKNLYELFQKIKRNPKFKTEKFINVLLKDLVHPHTFFNYIFFNKTKYKNNEIPNEVYLHEQTHATQKHALDILFIEVLQIVFWFNPLLYFIKKDIKLNHEFLADQAVLKQGIASSTYQKTLLAFSSPDSYRDAHSPLANAIHYSSIKKRFTVMKTHTSKKAIWLRSLIILPLLALLIYGFSEKKVIEKPQRFQIVNEEIKVHITKDRKVIIDNETIDFNSLSNKLIKLTENEKIKPLVYIEVEGHVDTKYLEEIKDKLENTNLKISMIRANSMFLDEVKYKKRPNDYFKGLKYTADSITLINEDGQMFKGISTPKVITDIIVPKPKSNEDYNIITIKVPRSSGYNINSNDLMTINNYVKENFYEKDKK